MDGLNKSEDGRGEGRKRDVRDERRFYCFLKSNCLSWKQEFCRSNRGFIVPTVY